MSGPWRRLAVAGSVKWPEGAAWEAVVTDKLWNYLSRMPTDSTLYLRHGHASEGPDNIAHRWCEQVRAAQDILNQGGDPYIAGVASFDVRTDVEIIEELVPADWETCNPTCKPIKADGQPHRRPNPGYPDAPRRGTLPDYCPSAGHWRNPEVVGFTYTGPQNRHERKHYHPIPDVHVSLLMAWIYNNSPGTSATLRHAQTMGVPWDAKGAYG